MATPTISRVVRSSANQIHCTCRLLLTNDHSSSHSSVSRPFFGRDGHGTRHGSIFGIDVVLEPTQRDARDTNDSRQRDFLEQQAVNQPFGLVGNQALLRGGNKLAATGFTLPFGLARMNGSVFYDLGTLAARAGQARTPFADTSLHSVPPLRVHDYQGV